MTKEKLKGLDIKHFIIPLISLILVLFLLSYFTINNRISENYKDFEEAALGIADSYSYLLINSQQAHEIISELLNEKLMVASQAVMLIEDNKNSETLSDLAERFQLDEIHLYNNDGEIVYSKGNKYIGWKAYEGHPVYKFMMSNKELLVEDIRQDTESGIYYKYAYVKNSDGTFVQIGVLADNIQRLIEKFEIQELINRISKRSNAIHVSFIDSEYKVMASSLPYLVGQSIEEESIHKQISEGEVHTIRTVLDNRDVFQVCVPIFYGNDRLGTLSVAWLTDKTDAEIRGIVFYGLIIFLFVTTMTGSVLYYAYRKNKSNIKIAYYDKLTGLPNSYYLIEYLEKAIKNLGKSKKAVMLLNCTNFKVLNMTYGFKYGDQILKQIACQIEDLLDSEDMLFRFNADRFILVVDNYSDCRELENLAQKIVDLFKKPFMGGTEHQYVNAEIGIIEIQHDNLTVDKVLQNVSIALSHIDNKPNGYISFYNEEMEKNVLTEEKIEKALRAIIAGNNPERLYLHFQPKLDIKKRTVMGFEALARLKIEGFGNISPLEFICVAEKKFLIYDLGNLILQKACEFIKNLNNSGHVGINVAVNISGIQLLRDEFVEDISLIIKSSGIDINSLEFEITESVLLNNFELINEKLEIIRRMGISISIDDFGTGFSSLARLRELNIDTVKLDKYFIRGIKSEDEEDLISSDIISMSHKIGLIAVAEGVENEHQKKYLEKHDCDIIQGYLLSEPLPELDAIEFLRIYNN